MRPKIIKIAVLVAVLGGLGYVAWAGIPHLTGSNHDVPKEADGQALHMARWVIKAARDGEPQKLWNAMADSWRGTFIAAFDPIRKGSVSAEWLKAASDAGLADDASEFAKLSDAKMFVAWWHLADRKIIGFRLPALFREPMAGKSEIELVKVFWETEPLKSNECHLLYKMGDSTDLLRFVRQEGAWRLDELKEVPAGM